MLNQEQNFKLQNNYLEVMIRQKGLYLDQETKTEMSYWRGVLEREVNENNQLRTKLQQIQQQIQELIKKKKRSRGKSWRINRQFKRYYQLFGKKT